MNYRSLIFYVFFLLFACNLSAQTKEFIPLVKNWNFKLLFNVDRSSGVPVDLPHTWNAQDGTSGQINYYRGAANYSKKVFIPKTYSNKRLFLRFEGVGTVADVFVNGDFVGNHAGGYSAFCFEITNKISVEKENEILVKVNNTYRTEIIPIEGDFVVYGGIYRPVYLVVAEQSCITPLDFASSGVYLTQRNVSEQSADVEITSKISNGSDKEQEFEVRSELFSRETKLVKTLTGKITVPAKNTLPFTQLLNISKPHLWNGTADAYTYQVRISLLQKGKIVDQVVQPLGLRYYSVDPEKGFFLNGNALRLNGVCRHQDRFGKGNALSVEDHISDFSIIREMGANAVRLSHYQQSEQVYNICDTTGILVWTEIPFVGSGGYNGRGYYNTPALHENVKQQLTELIRQNYNHPSIIFWGLFNELKVDNVSPTPFLKELNTLVKREDPTRLTTAASFQDGDLNFITDVIAWNKYFGWYSAKAEEMGNWLDKTHKTYPKLNIGISEYGAGASINQHADSLEKVDPNSRWHPEEWQTSYHEINWRELNKRPFVWGTFVWNMFDFASAFRNEGDAQGINDKGLVTFDRKIKKDAFYFYKANWNNEPMIYIAQRKHVYRSQPKTIVKVYCNQSQVELIVNGKQVVMHKSEMNTFYSEQVTLTKGKNTITARTISGGKTIFDSCEWYQESVY
ncbi:MAG: beta-galactosidase [Bacteroidales bacterium]|nr:beta-galactosidase [Bacteroidales bacterium]